MKRVLNIVYKRPGAILDGGERGSQKLLCLLERVVGKENVEVYYIHDADTKKHSILDYVQGVWDMLHGRFFGLTAKKQTEICQKAAQFDVVFIDRSLFGCIAKRLREQGYKGQIITHFHNVEEVYFDAKVPHIPGRGIVLRVADKNDRWSCEYSDQIIALNQRDAAELKRRYHREADAFMPVAFEDSLRESEVDKEVLTHSKPKCLFFGTYFPANAEGIMWFVREVLPYVNIEMQIVGKGMYKLKHDEPLLKDIEVLSNVPDLQPYLQAADIAILPILSGSGMKVKTCDALMNGKNIIGTPEAFEGYDVDYDKVGARCETREAFIAAIEAFQNQPRPRFNQYAREQFLQKFTYSAQEQTMRNLLAEKCSFAK